MFAYLFDGLINCVGQVFQSAIMEAKKYKASGGDALADVLDLLSHKHSGLDNDIEQQVAYMTRILSNK